MAITKASLSLFVSPNAMTSNGYTALTIASWCRPDFVRLLLSKGANPSVGGRFSPLSEVAALHSCTSAPEIVDMLVKAGAPMKICAPGISMLETVRIPEVAEALLRHGADPNQTCPPEGHSPLFNAVENPRILELLLKYGAKVVPDPRSKLTALHTAAGLGAKDYQMQHPERFESVNLLLAHGADVNAVDDQGRTPLDVAYEHGDKEMAALLTKHGAKAKKYQDLESGENAANSETEYQDLYGIADGVRKGPRCSLSMRGEDDAIMEEGDNWSIPLGTVGIVQVNCHAQGYFHYAVLGMGSPVPKQLNLPLSASARITFDNDWTNGEMHWYYSRERIKNLVSAISRGDATHFAKKLVNVAGE